MNSLVVRVVVAALVSSAVVAAVWALTRDDGPKPQTEPSVTFVPSPTRTERPSPSPTKTRKPTPLSVCEDALAHLHAFNKRIKAVITGINQAAGGHPEDVSEEQYRQAAKALARIEHRVEATPVPAQIQSLQQLERALAGSGSQAYNAAAEAVAAGAGAGIGAVFANAEALFSAVDLAFSTASC